MLVLNQIGNLVTLKSGKLGVRRQWHETQGKTGQIQEALSLRTKIANFVESDNWILVSVTIDLIEDVESSCLR